MSQINNYFEEELLRDLRQQIDSGSISIGASSVDHFSRLASAYPVLGSKIQWSKVPGSIQVNEDSEQKQLSTFSDFFREIVERNGLSGPAVYVGDGAVDFSLLSVVEEFGMHLGSILSIPQHHYFIAHDYSWCIVFAMEGDMAFGYRPT